MTCLEETYKCYNEVGHKAEWEDERLINNATWALHLAQLLGSTVITFEWIIKHENIVKLANKLYIICLTWPW